jgi:2-polyprenyl-3-methyl-5-hydroxy-6-metoxy-1,4-benzoquinol methylase
VTTGRLLLQGKRLVDQVAAHRVPRALTARYTTANAGESERMVPLLEAQGIDPAGAERTAAGRLGRDRRTLIPWLNRTRPLSSSRIVEVGCGLGASTVALAEQGATVLGVDVDADRIEVARLRCAAHGVHAEFAVANAADLATSVEPDASWIIFWASLEHMTISERLSALAAAWTLLGSGGLLTIVETPNRLWLADSHTSRLPYFNWLPDDLAFRYAPFSSRDGFRDVYEEKTDETMLHFLRRGRGVSFHEFELAIGPASGLDVTGCLQLDRRRRNPLRAAGWRVSRAGRFEALIAAEAPDVPRAFFQPFLYLTIRKP